MTSFRGILGKSQNSEISAILPYEISSFNFDLFYYIQANIMYFFAHDCSFNFLLIFEQTVFEITAKTFL